MSSEEREGEESLREVISKSDKIGDFCKPLLGVAVYNGSKNLVNRYSE